MSKSRNRRKRAGSVAPAPVQTRRQMLKTVRNTGLALAAVGGTGFWAVGSFRAYAAEHDLTQVGQGKPVVVQVHDPQCPTCTALQKQTRRALSGFAECDIMYLIADIKTPEGAAFAAAHGVPHVTLLLFDPSGDHVQTISGMRSSAELEQVFQQHRVPAGT